MSSTGTILAAIHPETRDILEQAMRNTRINIRFIGSFMKSKERILIKDGEEIRFPKKGNDPYTRILSSKI
jgi:hydrogenase maturation factor